MNKYASNFICVIFYTSAQWKYNYNNKKKQGIEARSRKHCCMEKE